MSQVPLLTFHQINAQKSSKEMIINILLTASAFLLMADGKKVKICFTQYFQRRKESENMFYIQYFQTNIIIRYFN